MKVAFVHDLFLGTMGEGISTTVMMNVKGENVQRREYGEKLMIRIRLKHKKRRHLQTGVRMYEFDGLTRVVQKKFDNVKD